MQTEFNPDQDPVRQRSAGGRWFSEDDEIWELDRNVKVNVGQVRAALLPALRAGFTYTLAHYASTLSSKHTANMAADLLAMLRATGSSSPDVATLLNFRAMLTRETEHKLGALAGFLVRCDGRQ
jgi:hypothetical protein